MVLYCAADLLWSTRIKATADALGLPCRPARTLEMLEARLADSPVRAIILDLDTGDLALSFIRRLRAPEGQPDIRPGIKIVAFGPHVAVELFEEARRLGADRVLARGAFDRQLPELLKELSEQ